MQTVVGLAQEVLHLYAGTLLPPTSEGVMAVFGAPVAQEDHARRAVAALALQQRRARPRAAGATGRHRPRGADGVHSGLVVLGELGRTRSGAPRWWVPRSSGPAGAGAGGPGCSS